MTIFKSALAAALIAVATPALAADLTAVDYDGTVRDCRAIDTIEMPVRTSGVDLPLIHATGYTEGTASGSPFDDAGLDVTLSLENDLAAQLKAYMTCETPFMRVTQGQLALTAPVVDAQASTKPVAIYQAGWSNGADALVVRDNIKDLTDLSGAVIAVQENGPQIDYVLRVISDAKNAAGASWTKPTIKAVDDPTALFRDDASVTAAFLPTTDAGVLTAGGVGTGAEGSVKGARTLMSTKSANRVISDVLVVRQDFFDANRDTVRTLVDTILSSEEKVREDVLKQIVEWDVVADILLRDDSAKAEAKELWRNVETVGLNGNTTWATPAHPRSFKTINAENFNALVDLGVMSQAYAFTLADWDWADIGGDLFDKRRTALPSFDNEKAAAAASGDKGEVVMEFEINFDPNQKTFPIADYEDSFAEVLEKAATYGGLVISVEGHSDPLKYLKMRAKGASINDLRRVRQAAVNLSVSRAMAVRDALMEAADLKAIAMDPSQFVVEGAGIATPKTGTCGDHPCAPKTEAEWRSNMRVVFKMYVVEAEASVFTPPNAW